MFRYFFCKYYHRILRYSYLYFMVYSPEKEFEFWIFFLFLNPNNFYLWPHLSIFGPISTTLNNFWPMLDIFFHIPYHQGRFICPNYPRRLELAALGSLTLVFYSKKCDLKKFHRYLILPSS